MVRDRYRDNGTDKAKHNASVAYSIDYRVTEAQNDKILQYSTVQYSYVLLRNCIVIRLESPPFIGMITNVKVPNKLNYCSILKSV